MHEFQAWPKTPRLLRDIVITEKLDGTNAAIHISAGIAVADPTVFEAAPLMPGEVYVDGRVWHISAQSRTRMITPGKTTDNYGFAAWVYDNAAALVTLLGEGVHYGEWWGRGIQRNYGCTARYFSLFNTDRHADVSHVVGSVGDQPVRVDTVPVLYRGPFSEAEITRELRRLRALGSFAVPGFMDPEGICVYHTASRQVFKVTLDNNDSGKWEAPTPV